MTERQDGPYGVERECLSCGSGFTPRKAGHVYCSSFCRHRGERRPDQRGVDHGAIERLFDASRQPDDRVRGDDWHATPECPEFVALDTFDTVRKRRRWYEELVAVGRL